MTGIIDALYKRILLAAHPVGSIYQSTVATSPAELFGVKWAPIEGRFLFAAGDGYVAGNVGGEATHTLTVDELPWHRITLRNNTYSFTWGGTIEEPTIRVQGTVGALGSPVGTELRTTQNLYNQTEPIGNNQPHNNMPPYIAVYTWQRTA